MNGKRKKEKARNGKIKREEKASAAKGDVLAAAEREKSREELD